MEQQIVALADVATPATINRGASILGKAFIVRAFYDKADVNPLWAELHQRCQNDASDAGAFMDLSPAL